MNGYTDHYGNHTDSTDGLFWPQPHSEQQAKPAPEEPPPQANPLALQIIKRPLLTLC